MEYRSLGVRKIPFILQQGHQKGRQWSRPQEVGESGPRHVDPCEVT